jgi:hypothetical protein
MLASNMVNSAASASIEFTGARGTVEAGTGVRVEAVDIAGIDADISLEVLAASTNDAGIGILYGVASKILDEYQYTSLSGVQDLLTGDMVRAADGNVYRFLGTEAQGRNRNLATQTYATSPRSGGSSTCRTRWMSCRTRSPT